MGKRTSIARRTIATPLILSTLLLGFAVLAVMVGSAIPISASNGGARLRKWARRVATEARYGVGFEDIGGCHPDLGGASQMAVFRMIGPVRETERVSAA